MCADPGCDGEEPAPVGESWCRRRLGIEFVRWLTGWPMKCGPDRDIPNELRRA